MPRLFRFNKFVYELPEGIDVEVSAYPGCSDFNFVRDGDWGNHLPMLGGTDENGAPLLTWAEIGIVRVS